MKIVWSKLMGICPHLSTIYNRSSLTAHHTAKYLNINVSQADKMSCHYFIWWKIVMEAATSFVKSNWTASGSINNQDVQSPYVFSYSVLEKMKLIYLIWFSYNGFYAASKNVSVFPSKIWYMNIHLTHAFWCIKGKSSNKSSAWIWKIITCNKIHLENLILNIK